MDYEMKNRGWLMAALLASVLLGLLVLGMSYASAQTATPATTGTATVAATGTVGATGTTTAAATTGTATIAATGTVAATGTTTAEATSAATAATSPTAAATTGAAATATRTPTAAATRAATATATITASLQISLPQQSYLPFELAWQAASAALEECQDQGYRVAVTVVDQSGVERVVLRGDRAGPHTLGSSFKKAFTSASLGSPTFGLVDRVTKDPTLAGLASMDERILLLAGGLPIRVNGEVVGGIGVGGAPSGVIDEECAQVGLDSLEEE